MFVQQARQAKVGSQNFTYHQLSNESTDFIDNVDVNKFKSLCSKLNLKYNYGKSNKIAKSLRLYLTIKHMSLYCNFPDKATV